LAVAGPVFARKKLGLSSDSTERHARVLGRSLFQALRQTSADVVNGAEETTRPDDVEELGARVFGVPLPKQLAGVWASGGGLGPKTVPGVFIDAPARLLGAVRGHGFVPMLVERFDEDWFSNPRAGTYLASVAAGPVWQGDVPADEAVRAIARGFEEALG
jgi:hypothetical protein